MARSTRLAPSSLPFGAPSFPRCRAAFVLGAAALLSGCFSVPLDRPKEASYAIPEDPNQVNQAEDVLAWVGGREDVNGFYPLVGGLEAFGARLELMDDAEVSIDAQYFLMKPDDAGHVFAAKLLEAADRGVRVRLLLDDIFTTVQDRHLSVLNLHENFEIRIFNPVSRRGIKAINYVGHFRRLNRRMHNKAFVVDNVLAVVGGRNIAAEYYQLETTGEFIDFDMICAGPIVREVSAEFDTYWNHELAIPLEQLADPASPEKLDEARTALSAEMAEAGGTIYGRAVHTEVVQQLLALDLDPYIAEATLLSDEPGKLLVPVSKEHQAVAGELHAAVDSAQEEVYLLTPYFIPGDRGVEFLEELCGRGVRVVVLTNSLATNNHTSVHSAYSSYRKDLLRAGVELWEARADAAKIVTEEGETQLDQLTLHTKGVLIDRRHVFVGSLNLDPRSIEINTEMGLLIDSPALGAELTGRITSRLSDMAYRVELDEDGDLRWHGRIDGEPVVETKEPQTSCWRRCKAWFLKIVPEKQL